MSSSLFGKDYFDGRKSHFSKFGGYDNISSKSNHFNELSKIILSYAKRKGRLLDIGCAYGHFLQILKSDFNVCGSDISCHAIKVAKSRLSVPLIVSSIEERVGFKGLFDVITAIDVIEHLRTPKKALFNINKSLRRGGFFFFETPTVSNWLSFLINRFVYSLDKTHVFVKSFDEVKQLVESAGFTYIASFSTCLPVLFKNKLIVKSLSNVLFVFRKN